MEEEAAIPRRWKT